MKLQEELSKDFDKHKIVLNVFYGHIYKAAAYNVHVIAIIKRMGAVAKLAQETMPKTT